MGKEDSGAPSQRKTGRPITKDKVITKSSRRGTKENESRVTFIVNDQTLDKVRSIAYWKRVAIKDVVAGALSSAIDNYEAAEGPVQPIPER